MPAPSSTPELIDLVRKSGIHPPDALNQSLSEFPLPADPAKTAAVLVRRGVLTSFQAKLLLAGKFRGFRVGPYVIRDQLGQGGMGTVYLAEHETLRRRVAIKVLSAAELQNKVAIERFFREARAAAALDHPNIVRIFDVGQNAQMHYLVMEYVDGQTLDKLVDHGGPIACGRAVEYITQAAAGLQHAYEKGFVHRDIKPANLMLAKDGTVKILDMGLARSFDQSDKLTEILDRGAVVGTADYISPEQAMNCPDLDIRADIYSLGATFFTLVTGRPPFDGNTTQKLLQHQMKPPPTLLSIDKTFPPGLSVVVGRMLAKRPDERFQSPAEVIAALAPWLPGSDKVLAGISRTDMAKSPELQATLNEMVSGTTKRLTRRTVPAGLVEKLKANWPLAAAGAAAVVVVLGLIVAAIFGAFSSGKSRATEVASGPPTPTVTPPPEERNQKPPAPAKSGPNPNPPPAPPPVPQGAPAAPAPRLDGVVYDLDLTGRQRYTIRGKVLGDPAKGSAKWTETAKTGSGPFPPGWQPSATTEGAEYQGLIDDKGGPALGVRAPTPATTATLLAPPDLPFPSAKAHLFVEYMTESASGEVAVRFRPRSGDTFEAGRLPATGGKWEDKELEVNLNGATGGRFEFVAGSDPKGGLWVRRFTARDPVPVTERVIYKVNLSSQLPFVQRTRKFQAPGSNVPLTPVFETGAGKLPPSWYRWLEAEDTVGEYFADGPPGQLSFGMRNYAGTPGTMLTSPEFQTRDGKCRLRVLYQTGPTSPGFVLRFRPTKPDKRATWDVTTLPGTGGSWRLAVVDLDLRGSTAGHFELSNTTAGPDAAVRLNEFLITDPD
jgi:serine/threonine protein kinase